MCDIFEWSWAGMKPGSRVGDDQALSLGCGGMGGAGDNVSVFEGPYFDVGRVGSKFAFAVGDEQWGVPVKVWIVFG